MPCGPRYIVSDNLTTAEALDISPLRKGPIDVTLWILRGVEGLAVSFIERDVLFQLIRQVGL